MHVDKITKQNREARYGHNLRIGKFKNNKNVIPELTKNNMVLVERNDPFEGILEQYKENCLKKANKNMKLKNNGEISKTSKDEIDKIKNLTVEQMLFTNRIDKEKEKSLIFHFPFDVNNQEFKTTPQYLGWVEKYFTKVVDLFKQNNVLINSAVVHNDEAGKAHMHLISPMCSVDVEKAGKGFLIGENNTFSKIADGVGKKSIKSFNSLDKIDRKIKKEYVATFSETFPELVEEVLWDIDNAPRAKFSYTDEEYKKRKEYEKQHDEQYRSLMLELSNKKERYENAKEQYENAKEKLKMEKRKQQEELENEKEKLKMKKRKQNEELERLKELPKQFEETIEKIKRIHESIERNLGLMEGETNQVKIWKLQIDNLNEQIKLKEIQEEAKKNNKPLGDMIENILDFENKEPEKER